MGGRVDQGRGEEGKEPVRVGRVEVGGGEFVVEREKRRRRVAAKHPALRRLFP